MENADGRIGVLSVFLTDAFSIDRTPGFPLARFLDEGMRRYTIRMANIGQAPTQ